MLHVMFFVFDSCLNLLGFFSGGRGFGGLMIDERLEGRRWKHWLLAITKTEHFA